MSEMRVGMLAVGEGVEVKQRATKTAALVVAAGHGGLVELAMNNCLMLASTAVAGVAPGTALSTTPPICLWNPLNSGKNLAILKSFLGLKSGTLGGGSIVYGFVPAQNAAPTTGSELTVQSCKLGSPNGVGRVFQGSTVVATPTILRPAFLEGAMVDTTAIGPQNVVDYVDGEIIVPPGNCFIIQGVAGAGTSPLLIFGLLWEEITIV